MHPSLPDGLITNTRRGVSVVDEVTYFDGREMSNASLFGYVRHKTRRTPDDESRARFAIPV